MKFVNIIRRANASATQAQTKKPLVELCAEDLSLVSGGARPEGGRRAGGTKTGDVPVVSG